jgi:ribosome biogenesis GTPase
VIEQLGWDADWQRIFEDQAPPDTRPARVTRIDKGGLTVNTELNSSALAVASSGARGNAVGDWVALSVTEGRIEKILPRRTVFLRRSPGISRDQLAVSSRALAANMNWVLVLQPLDLGVNPRRLARELVQVWESGARPLVVLTKADAVEAEQRAFEVRLARSAAPNTEVLTVSNRTGAGIAELLAALGPNTTIALLGASGAGKSSLVNAIAGRPIQLTTEVRTDDGRGRHTTTAGQLISLDQGRLLIDTPGIRSVGLWRADQGLELAFADLSPFAQACRFEDCSHTSEPGCGLIEAVESGELAGDRLDIWQQLAAEMAALEDELVEAERLRVRSKNQRSLHKSRQRDRRLGRG